MGKSKGQIKGTFSKGWWNCFYSFADEVIATPHGESICMNVLEAAGITKKEAEYRVEHPTNTMRAVDELIRRYWLSLR